MDTRNSLTDSLRERLPGSQYAKLLPAEALLIQALGTHDDANFLPQQGSQPRPERPEDWKRAQEIRGGFLQWICLQLLDMGVQSEPVVSITGARLTQDKVDLSELSLVLALKLQSCRIDLGLDVSESHLLTLEVDGCWMPWMDASRTTLDKDWSMAGVQITGTLSFEGASVGGSLYGSDGVFGQRVPDCADGGERCHVVLMGQDVNVGGSIYLDNAKVWGGVVLIGAKIGGDLDCQGAQMDGLGGSSLILDKTSIDGGMFLSAKFSARGQVRVTNAVIKNGIEADAGIFQVIGRAGKSPVALRIENSQITGDTRLGKGFQAEGLSLKTSQFGTLALLGEVTGSGELNLENTQLRLYTDVEKYWPAPGRLHLDGFVYEGIHDASNLYVIDVDKRLDWLKRDAAQPSQPFLQLARVLKDHGDDDGSTEVLIVLQGRLVAASPVVSRVEGESMAPVGFGYSPQNAVWFLLATVGIGWVVYRRSYLAGHMTPTECDAYSEFKKTQKTPAHYPRFSPLVYSLENTFPLVVLGQASKWQPDPDAEMPCESGPMKTPEAERGGRLKLVAHHGPKMRLRVFLWVQILLGWLLATLFVAGISGLIRK